MSIKAALVQGQSRPNFAHRLESMGFEIVDMNDNEAMKDLCNRLQIQESIQVVDDMGIDTFKRKRIGIVGALGHIGIGRECLAASILPAIPIVVDAVNRLNELEEQAAMQRVNENQLVMHLKAYEPEPMPDIRIEKTKDRFSFADRFVGRGRGPRK